MNDKKRTTSGDNIQLDLGDLDTLEQEMNDLTGNYCTTACCIYK